MRPREGRSPDVQSNLLCSTTDTCSELGRHIRITGSQRWCSGPAPCPWSQTLWRWGPGTQAAGVENHQLRKIKGSCLNITGATNLEDPRERLPEVTHLTSCVTLDSFLNLYKVQMEKAPTCRVIVQRGRDKDGHIINTHCNYYTLQEKTIICILYLLQLFSLQREHTEIFQMLLYEPEKGPGSGTGGQGLLSYPFICKQRAGGSAELPRVPGRWVGSGGLQRGGGAGTWPSRPRPPSQQHQGT